MAHATITKHRHNYSIKTPLAMTAELKNIGIQDVQLRECECGKRKMFMLNKDCEWEQIKEGDSIYRLMHMR